MFIAHSYKGMFWTEIIGLKADSAFRASHRIADHGDAIV
jgi:hypothetical protein